MFGKKPGVDPDYDLIMDESLAKNEYPYEKIWDYRSKEKCSLGEADAVSASH